MKTLLVIDRQRRTRRELRSLLGARYRVLVVHSVFRAFRILRRQRFDVVLVKTAAWDAYAIAVLKWLQLRDLRIPVVALLGSGASRDAKIVRHLGANVILRWPAPSSKLLEGVASAGTVSVTGAVGASDTPFTAREGHIHPTAFERLVNRPVGLLPGGNCPYTRSVRYRDHHRGAWYICGRRWRRLC